MHEIVEKINVVIVQCLFIPLYDEPGLIYLQDEKAKAG